jgi:hypothetical protein
MKVFVIPGLTWKMLFNNLTVTLILFTLNFPILFFFCGGGERDLITTPIVHIDLAYSLEKTVFQLTFSTSDDLHEILQVN